MLTVSSRPFGKSLGQLICLFLTVFLTSLPILALAENAEAVPRELPPGLSDETLENLNQGRVDIALDRLLRNESVYAGNPDFDYLLGIVALRANANTLALNALERVVLLYPERAGAWIDLAIAHARLGEVETASTLLDHVEQSFEVPPALKEALSKARRQLLAARLTDGWHGELLAAIGFDNNANSGLSSDRLSLTLGGTPAIFEIAPEYRRRSDTFMQLGTYLRRSWNVDFAGNEGRLNLHLAGRLKTYKQEKDFDLTDDGVFASYQRTLFGGEAELGTSRQHVRLGGAPLVEVGLLQVSWGPLPINGNGFRNCRPKGILEKEYRDYPERQYLDGRILWLGGKLSCTSAIGEFALALRTGSDQQNNSRPGGNSRRKEITLFHQRPLWSKLNAEVLLSLSKNDDAEGYSPIIDNNIPRHIDRRYGRIGLFWPVTANVDGLASLEVTRQKSNISLFDQNDNTITVGARYRF